ncbi:glycosyltransferase [uncultured Zobellia sp.]|uniref:glycosyltransferase n=1 Tax=uncultured Zobellia sp. TaxID=255433 RepID=UPI0025941022|nr:glycosyltransferase [uncultured Zobellia sp.]
MKKVLIIYNRLWHYRVPIFNLLSEKYDLTVTYSVGKDVNDDEVNFKVKELPGRDVLGQFYIHKDSLHELSKNYDVVIGYSDIRWLSLMGLLFKKKPYKFILWGIGVRASYTTAYGSKTKWDKVRFYFMRKADALVFYSADPIKTYLSEGFTEEKMFVANNTVEVRPINKNLTRDSIVFIGTLYKQKQIYELLGSYKEAKQANQNVPKLEIIGGGDEYENIKVWIIENHFEDTIFLRGKIFDEDILCDYFSSAIACISPGQSGLSVLKSMGYGVPYISKKNAITGGEIFNIEHGVSGILYEDDSQLSNIILDIAEDTDKYIKMGKNAKKHYDDYRKPQDMANGLIDAIEYVNK